MVIKALGIKKGGGTVTNLVLSLFVFMFIFMGMYLYWADNINTSGIAMESEYADAYNNISKIANDTYGDMETIRQNAEALESVDENWANAVWNGIKGLGNSLLLPIRFLARAMDLKEVSINMISLIPGWILLFITSAILVYIVFLVLRVAKGEQAL